MEINLPLTPSNETPEPTLIAAAIPHSIRHGAIHGALGTREVGESMVLVAPHNPVPLLKEVEAREESFEMEYLTEGPDTWRIRFTRVA